MKKIESQLAALIDREPGNSYPVVVVCSSLTNLQKIGLDRIMDTIYSGKLTGVEIMELALLDEVHSIELDKAITLD